MAGSKTFTDEQNEAIRGHVRQLLAERGHSQRALGDELGVSQQTISSLLGRRSGASFSLVQRLAAARGVAPQDLLAPVQHAGPSTPGKLKQTSVWPSLSRLAKDRYPDLSDEIDAYGETDNWHEDTPMSLEGLLSWVESTRATRRAIENKHDRATVRMIHEGTSDVQRQIPLSRLQPSVFGSACRRLRSLLDISVDTLSLRTGATMSAQFFIDLEEGRNNETFSFGLVAYVLNLNPLDFQKFVEGDDLLSREQILLSALLPSANREHPIALRKRGQGHGERKNIAAVNRALELVKLDSEGEIPGPDLVPSLVSSVLDQPSVRIANNIRGGDSRSVPQDAVALAATILSGMSYEMLCEAAVKVFTDLFQGAPSADVPGRYALHQAVRRLSSMGSGVIPAWVSADTLVDRIVYDLTETSRRGIGGIGRVPVIAEALLWPVEFTMDIVTVLTYRAGRLAEDTDH